MKKKLRGILSFVLALAMILSGLTVVPAQTVQAEEKAAPEEYQIYPTPQSIVYSEDETLDLSSGVNAVFESGVDEATRNRLTGILADHDIPCVVSDAEAEGAVNILVGIHGSGGAADVYAEKLSYSEGLFERTDAYLLVIGEDQITVVGKDTDAAFYGLASLKMIIEQSQDKIVRQLQMDDYAVGQYRGFIEGYYGIPWSVDDRISLMQFGGDFKMNIYIFAPKDDPYHNTKWRELYPDEKLADIKRMVEAGAASKCRFAWAIHPFMHDAITSSTYDEDLKVIKAKFQQLYDAGVRQFVISADDAGGKASLHAKLLKDMTAWVKEKGDCYNLCFVPQVYCSGAVSWSNWMDPGEARTVANYFKHFSDIEDLELMWTGEYVCHPATQYTFDNFKSKSGQEAFMWLNWPVNDVNHARLVMGPAEQCILNVGTTGFKGIVTNPLEQAEASKTSLFAIADYTWNTSDFDCMQSWKDGFQYIDAGAPDALCEICQHLTNPSPGGITGMDESWELDEYIDAFQDDLDTGRDLTESGNALAARLQKIADAADDFQTNGINENLKEEMKPWVDSLRAISKAAAAYVKTAMALQSGDQSAAVANYLKAVNEETISKNCFAPQLSGTIKVEAGAQVIMPFVSAMGKKVKSDVEALFNHQFGGSGTGGGSSSTEATLFYEGLGGFYQGNSANITDGNDSTYAWFNKVVDAGAYIGLDLGDIYRIDRLRVLQGTSATHGDVFDSPVIEYSVDGVTYTQIERLSGVHDIDRDYSDLGIAGRYIRIRTPVDTAKWYAIREFSVSTSAATEDAYTNSVSAAETQVEIVATGASVVVPEGGLQIQLGANEYFGIKLPKIREVTEITADYTADGDLVLEASLDGYDWTAVSTGEQVTDLHYLRLHNTGESEVTLSLTALSLKNTVNDVRFIGTEGLEDHEIGKAFDDDLATSYIPAESTGSLTWRIGDPTQISAVYIVSDPDMETDAQVWVMNEEGEWLNKGTLAAGLSVATDLEWEGAIRAVKIEWQTGRPQILEMYTVEPRTVGISLDKNEAKVQIGETVKLHAEVVLPPDADRTIHWISSDPEVASVEDGVVTAHQVGEVTITAEAGGYQASCEVIVSRRGIASELTITAVTAGSEEIANASSTEGPARYAIDGNSSTYWHSLWAGDSMSNLWISVDLGAVYDVSRLQYLPRPGAGNGTITSYEVFVSTDGENWYKAAVGDWERDTTWKNADIISEVPARYVKLAAVHTHADSGKDRFASAAEIKVLGYEHDETMADRRQALHAALSDWIVPEAKYTEESYAAYRKAKEEVTEIAGRLTATQDQLDAAVKAYNEAAAGLVVLIPLTAIEVTPASLELRTGSSKKLNVTLVPADATYQDVTFESDQPEIASVNEEGLVEAKIAGVAVITVTGKGGVKATCTVTVTDMVRDSLELLYQTWADADLTVYTQESADAVTDALAAAKVVLDNPKTTRGEMDAAMSALVKALGSLEYGVQKLHLETALQAADAILAIGKNYEDVAALTEAVDAGKEVLANEKASQEEVDNAAYAILDELFRIAKKADISSLESLIEAAEGLPGGNYTSDTLERLKDAIEKAKEVTADQNRGENDITDAYENLIDAIINLKMKGNKAALKAMLIKANQVLKDADAYVAETVEGLAKVTEDAQVVYDNEDALQSEVNEAVKVLTLEVAKARLKGDVNDDGKVDTADSVVVLRASAELMTLDASAAASADVNGDGKADTGDAVLILQYAAEEITAF